MNVVIGASVGDGGANKPNDVLQIDGLLRKVGMLGPMSPTNQSRAEAIRRFQEIWGIRSGGRFDGKVDPNGTTLRKLNDTANPLQLHAISRDKVSKGGYKISFKPEAPPEPYKVLLGASTMPGDYLDVSDADPRDVMTAENLPGLLKVIKKANRWGGTLNVKLFVALEGKVITESAPLPLPCPVQPHNGKLLPLDRANNGPELIYQKDENGYCGRMLTQIAGLDELFFIYGGQLETENAHRGFDCTTYAGTVCGVPTTSMGTGQAVADASGAATCTLEKTEAGPPPKTVKIDLEQTDPQNVKDFFAKNTTGYYVMWQAGHVVMVANGTVYEFAESVPGYRESPVLDWLKKYKTVKLSVRKLSGKPPRAT